MLIGNDEHLPVNHNGNQQTTRLSDRILGRPPGRTGLWARGAAAVGRRSSHWAARQSTWTIDALIAAGVVLTAWASLALTHEPAARDADPAAYVLLLVAAGPLVFRRHHPTVMTVASTAGTLAYFASDYPGGPPTIAMLIVLYSAAVAGRRLLALGVAAGFAGGGLMFRAVVEGGELITILLDSVLYLLASILGAVVYGRVSALEKSNEELRAVDRMKHDFIALVSHEMRTPLTVVHGFSRLMAHTWDRMDDVQRTAQIEAVGRSTRRLERLIDDLLRAAALDGRLSPPAAAGGPPILVQPLLVNIVYDSEFESADVPIDCRADLHSPVDADLVTTVLSNLLTNAYKYGRPPICIAASDNGSMLEIVVRDHGPGLPKEFVEHAFGQFTQASGGDRRTSTGMGLGLWIARTFAESCNGELVYEPATPGAAFRLRIPHETTPTVR